MNQIPQNPEQPQPESWNDILGPFTRTTDLSDGIRESPGLIVLETRQGTEVCPEFQFELNGDGQCSLNRHVEIAWQMLSGLQVDQLGEGKWTKAAALIAPRAEFNGKSWADVLKDPAVDQTDKTRVYYEIALDADMGSRVGIGLVHPRTILPE